MHASEKWVRARVVEAEAEHVVRKEFGERRMSSAVIQYTS